MSTLYDTSWRKFIRRLWLTGAGIYRANIIRHCIKINRMKRFASCIPTVLDRQLRLVGDPLHSSVLHELTGISRPPEDPADSSTQRKWEYKIPTVRISAGGKQQWEPMGTGRKHPGHLKGLAARHSIRHTVRDSQSLPNPHQLERRVNLSALKRHDPQGSAGQGPQQMATNRNIPQVIVPAMTAKVKRAGQLKDLATTIPEKILARAGNGLIFATSDSDNRSLPDKDIFLRQARTTLYGLQAGATLLQRLVREGAGSSSTGQSSALPPGRAEKPGPVPVGWDSAGSALLPFSKKGSVGPPDANRLSSRKAAGYRGPDTGLTAGIPTPVRFGTEAQNTIDQTADLLPAVGKLISPQVGPDLPGIYKVKRNSEQEHLKEAAAPASIKESSAKSDAEKSDLGQLAEKIKQILDDEARRFGIDL